jgi:hypothetical protein
MLGEAKGGTIWQLGYQLFSDFMLRIGTVCLFGWTFPKEVMQHD